MSTSKIAKIAVLQKYRSFGRLIRHLPSKRYNLDDTWKELRIAFRQPLAAEESLDQRLAKAEERISFLRMVTPKSAHRCIDSGTNTITTQNNSRFSGGKWVYKDGKRFENVSGTMRDTNGRVVPNWDGKNLDPDSVKRHNHHLQRLGYRNNAHAKGIF
jgi:hypothetical protein